MDVRITICATVARSAFGTRSDGSVDLVKLENALSTLLDDHMLGVKFDFDALTVDAEEE